MAPRFIASRSAFRSSGRGSDPGPYVQNRSDCVCDRNSKDDLPVSGRDVAVMQTKHLGDWSSAAKVCGYGEIQSCRICVSEFVEAERGLVTEDSCGPVAPVARPEHPEDQVRAVRLRESCDPVNSAMFADPIASADVVDSLVAGVSERGCLLRSEVATLRFRELVEIFLSLKWRLQDMHKRSTLWTYYAGHPDSSASRHFRSRTCPVGPYRVTCDGSHGTHGNPGNLKSVSCRYNSGLAGTTPFSSTIMSHVPHAEGSGDAGDRLLLSEPYESPCVHSSRRVCPMGAGRARRDVSRHPARRADLPDKLRKLPRT